MHQKPAAFYKYTIVCLVFLFAVLCGKAQGSYELRYRFVDTITNAGALGLQTEFKEKSACSQYIFQMPELLKKKGFITSSIDSVTTDSSFAVAIVFLGKRYSWAQLNTASVPDDLLNAAGYRDKNFNNQLLNYTLVEDLQKRLLDKLENAGYPFAKVYLDSFNLINE